MIESWPWWIAIGVGLGLSALFSGLETGAYSLNRVRLHILDHQGVRAAVKLRRLLDAPTSLLGTLLIGNNLANYLGTAGLTVVLENMGLSDWQTILLNVAVITPLLFIFGETLPKDLFSAYADRLMYRFAGLLTFTRRLFVITGLLPLVNLFSSGVMHLTGRQHRNVFHPRRQVTNLVKEGVGMGLLSDEQSAMVERVLAAAHRRTGDEMTPWSKVIKVRLTDPPTVLWDLADQTSRSRFPVVDGHGKVMGVVEVLDALLHPKDRCPPIEQLTKPATMLVASLPLRPALTRLQEARAPMGIVVDNRNRPVGIATIKDLVEPITGELSSW